MASHDQFLETIYHVHHINEEEQLICIHLADRKQSIFIA